MFRSLKDQRNTLSRFQKRKGLKNNQKKKPNKQRNTIENVRLKIRMSDNIYSRVGTKHYKES